MRTRSHEDKYDLIWPDPHITLTLHPGEGQIVPPEIFVAAAAQAAATWSSPQVSTSVELVLTTASGPLAAVGFDHENSVIFQTEGWSSRSYPPDALALTTVWDAGGQITEADVELNAVDPRFHWAALSADPAVAALARDVDLQNALTHELGHLLGLAHPCDLGPGALEKVDNYGQPIPRCSAQDLPAGIAGATMFPSTKSGNISERNLSPDEMMALSDLYTPGRPPMVDGPSSTAGCSVAGASPGPMVPSVGLAAVLFARRTRRKRRVSARDAGRDGLALGARA